jgi:hypothetical protein
MEYYTSLILTVISPGMALRSRCPFWFLMNLNRKGCKTNQYIAFVQFQHAEAQFRLHINDQVQLFNSINLTCAYSISFIHI